MMIFSSMGARFRSRLTASGRRESQRERQADEVNQTLLEHQPKRHQNMLARFRSHFTASGRRESQRESQADEVKQTLWEHEQKLHQNQGEWEGNYGPYDKLAVNANRTHHRAK